MHPLLEALSKEGCDIKKGLELCMNSEDFYIKILGIASRDKNVINLEKAYSEKDIPLIFRCSHSLKSVYANTGLTFLSELNTPIVETARRGKTDGIGEAIANLAKEHNRIMNIIKKYV